MDKRTIDVDRFREMVREELAALREGADHASVHGVVSSASKLMGALEKFKESAPAEVTGALSDLLDPLEKRLDHMLDAPRAYVPKLRPEPKRVSLVKKDDES